MLFQFFYFFLAAVPCDSLPAGFSGYTFNEDSATTYEQDYGIAFSPKYPNRYPSGTNCGLTIKVSTKAIMLYIIAFYTTIPPTKLDVSSV